MNIEVFNILNSLSLEISEKILEKIINKDSNILDEDEDFFHAATLINKENTFRPERIYFLYFSSPPVILKEKLQIKNNDDEEVDEWVVTISEYTHESNYYISGDNRPLDDSPVGMHLNIFLPEGFNNNHSLYAKLFDEIKNTARHEIEHIVQQEYPQILNYLDYHKIDFRPDEGLTSNMTYYLTQPAEIAAHVRGYESISNTHFDFYKRILEFLRCLRKGEHISEEEELRIFLSWKDWFLRNTFITEKGM